MNASEGGGGGDGGRGKGKGPSRWGLAALAVLAAGALVVTGTVLASSDSDSGADSDNEPDAAADPSGRAPQTPGEDGTPSASASVSATVEDDGELGGKGKGGGKGDESPDSSSLSIPSTGPGTFTTAGGRSGTVGKGARVLRYKVVVEDGLAQSAEDVARQVEGVLADPRGWTADGDSGFRRVSSGTSDFVVRLATPGTVDEICGRYGLNTRGEVNCNVGQDVVVNLKRWLLATPVYAQDVDAYRALIINHEVGHFLGYGHVTCPGKGKPAPAMMQQIKGMHGCEPNVWPYDTKGKLITGPAVP
ncbi:DUF3152 domain-containing protein [Streptomyces sp. CWNU-52B]|uniref:DUF3152 domain-containing protein n=1 Tax=unclassified Streptomyces TaxID=2593676 RepID=UPI0039C1318E